LTTLDHCDSLLEIEGGRLVPTATRSRREVARA